MKKTLKIFEKDKKQLKVNKNENSYSYSINGLIAEYDTFNEMVQDVIKRGGDLIINKNGIFISNLKVFKGSLNFN